MQDNSYARYGMSINRNNGDVGIDKIAGTPLDVGGGFVSFLN